MLLFHILYEWTHSSPLKICRLSCLRIFSLPHPSLDSHKYSQPPPFSSALLYSKSKTLSESVMWQLYSTCSHSHALANDFMKTNHNFCFSEMICFFKYVFMFFEESDVLAGTVHKDKSHCLSASDTCLANFFIGRSNASPCMYAMQGFCKISVDRLNHILSNIQKHSNISTKYCALTLLLQHIDINMCVPHI